MFEMIHCGDQTSLAVVSKGDSDSTTLKLPAPIDPAHHRRSTFTQQWPMIDDRLRTNSPSCTCHPDDGRPPCPVGRDLKVMWGERWQPEETMVRRGTDPPCLSGQTNTNSRHAGYCVNAHHRCHTLPSYTPNCPTQLLRPLHLRMTPWASSGTTVSSFSPHYTFPRRIPDRELRAFHECFRIQHS